MCEISSVPSAHPPADRRSNPRPCDRLVAGYMSRSSPDLPLAFADSGPARGREGPPGCFVRVPKRRRTSARCSRGLRFFPPDCENLDFSPAAHRVRSHGNTEPRGEFQEFRLESGLMNCDDVRRSCLKRRTPRASIRVPARATLTTETVSCSGRRWSRRGLPRHGSGGRPCRA